MKRSEYRAKRLADYSTDPKAVPDAWLDHDCDAAEAAGVVWDPEDPRLPKRLVRGFDGAGSCLWPLGERGWKGYSPKAIEAAYDKAARAYNILPEIEEAFHRWQDEDYGNFRADENFAETLGRLLHGEDGGS